VNIYCGLDEVGTGCLAGPIVSVAVQMQMTLDAWPMPEVKDSKKTTATQRARSVESILRFVHSQGGIVGVGESSVEEINSLGHTAALQLSYKRAVREATLFERPKLLLVDGDFGVDGYAGPQRIAPKMDANNFLCAAASIIAKVYRDLEMDDLAKQFPTYKWDSNRGYGTKEHVQALNKYGLSPLHREKAAHTALRKVA
jgi:ribonuclease HII